MLSPCSLTKLRQRQHERLQFSAVESSECKPEPSQHKKLLNMKTGEILVATHQDFITFCLIFAFVLQWGIVFKESCILLALIVAELVAVDSSLQRTIRSLSKNLTKGSFFFFKCDSTHLFATIFTFQLVR